VVYGVSLGHPAIAPMLGLRRDPKLDVAETRSPAIVPTLKP
jgi:hypothetical protein